MPSDGFAVFASAPGWVSRVHAHRGELEIDHGGGWVSAYHHMTGIAVSSGQYVGRGHVIGRVGNVDVRDWLGGPGPAHLHYEQRQHGRATRVHVEGRSVDPNTAGVMNSTNNCGGGGATAFDVPVSSTPPSPTRSTLAVATHRLEDHALFERWYDGTWNGSPTGDRIVGRPAVAVWRGELHVVARRSDGTLFDRFYNPLVGWRIVELEGEVAGDPDATVYGWGNNLRIAARGTDGFLYQWWIAANGSWTKPVRVGNIQITGTPALIGHYDTLYIVARDRENTLRSWEADRRGRWTEWQLGTALDDPRLGIDPQSGRVTVFARGPGGTLTSWESQDPDDAADHAIDGWSRAQIVDAERPVIGIPATAIYHGMLHVVARGTDNALHHWWRDAATWHHELTGGAFAGKPDLVPFLHQLQAIGRSADHILQTVWFDPVSEVWTVEQHDLAIAE
jgi:hypothetical protein